MHRLVGVMAYGVRATTRVSARWAARRVKGAVWPESSPMHIHAAQLRMSPPQELMKGTALIRGLVYRLARLSSWTAHADCKGVQVSRPICHQKQRGELHKSPVRLCRACRYQVHDAPATYDIQFLCTGLLASCMDIKQAAPPPHPRYIWDANVYPFCTFERRMARKVKAGLSSC